MMDLKKFYDEDVIIEAVGGKKFSGHVGDYVEPIHNANGKASIIVDDPKETYPVEFYEDDIKSITIAPRVFQSAEVAV